MKIIDVPKAIDIPVIVLSPIGAVDPDATKPSNFKEFLQVSLDSYKPLGHGLDKVRQSFKIAGIVSSIEEPTEEKKTSIQFEDADFDVVKAAVGAMEWKPGFARHVLPFYEAVEAAQSVTVEKKA